MHQGRPVRHLVKHILLASRNFLQRSHGRRNNHIAKHRVKLILAHQPVVFTFKIVGKQLKLIVLRISSHNLPGLILRFLKECTPAALRLHAERIVHINAHNLLLMKRNITFARKERLSKRKGNKNDGHYTSQQNQPVQQFRLLPGALLKLLKELNITEEQLFVSPEIEQVHNYRYKYRNQSK